MTGRHRNVWFMVGLGCKHILAGSWTAGCVVLGEHFATLVAAAWFIVGVSFGSLAQSQEIGGWRLRPAHPYDNVTALAFTLDSQQLFVGSALGKISIVDVRSRHTVKSLSGPQFLDKVAMSPEGDVLAGIRSGFEDILLWNPRNWTLLPSLPTPNRSEDWSILRPRQRVDAYSIAFSPDGRILAAGCGNHSIVFWDMASRKISHVVYGHLGTVGALSFSPDSTLLASVSSGESHGSPVVIWDVKTGYRVKVIIAHVESTTCVVFLPEGNRVVSSGIDGPMLDSATSDVSIRIWDIGSGRNIQTLRGHTNSVRTIIPLPGGKLITGGNDRTIRLWDLSTSRELRKVSRDGAIETLVLSPDGKYLACGLISSEGHYDLWKLSEIFPEAVKE